MNKITAVGRLTADPTITESANGAALCHFTVAANTRRKNAAGQPLTNFYRCTVWRAIAENCARYLQKGSQCAVEGNIQNRTYEKDGEKRYITEIVADRVEFLGRPAQSNGGSGYDEFGRKEAIEDLPSVEDDTELPF